MILDKKYYIFLLLFTLVCNGAENANNKFPDRNAFVQKIKKQFLSSELSVSNIIMPYIDTEDWQLRQMIYFQSWHIIRFGDVSEKRKHALMEFLVAGLNDPLANPRNILTWLIDCEKKDFSEKTKTILLEYYNNVELNYNNILLYGIVGLHIKDNELKKLSQKKIKDSDWDWQDSRRWASLLVLARRGDLNATSRVMEIALDILGFKISTTNMLPTVSHSHKPQTQPIYIGTVKNIFRDIAYIKQPQSIEFLWAFLNSDERLGNKKNILIAKFSITQLSKLLDDFPVKMRYMSAYTEGELTVCRKWMKANAKRVKSLYHQKMKK